MRWNPHKKKDPNRKYKWGSWFAWRPVEVKGTWVWMEWVWRKRMVSTWGVTPKHKVRWIYMLPEVYAQFSSPDPANKLVLYPESKVPRKLSVDLSKVRGDLL